MQALIKEKKVPMRQCVGCREMHQKRELIRVVKSKEGEISLDFNGRLPGRGAYICKDAECLARAIKSKALERAFSCAISPDVYARLQSSLSEDKNEE